MTEESKCPVTGKIGNPTDRRWRDIEPGLVAEPVEPQDFASALS